MQKMKNIPVLAEKPKKKDQFSATVDAEFEKFTKQELISLKEDICDMIANDGMPTEEGEKIIKRRREQYQQAGQEEKVSGIVNNFHLWFPNGYHRKLIEELKIIKPEALTNLEEDEKFMSDFDETLNNSEYANCWEEILSKKNGTPEEKTQRLKMILDLFLKMRAKGYKDKKLRT